MVGKINTIPDVNVRNEGSLWTFIPLTDKASNWIDENIHSEAHNWIGPMLCVEHRFGSDIANGMKSDGLIVNFNGA